MSNQRTYRNPPPRKMPTVEHRKIPHIEQRKGNKGKTEETGVLAFCNGSIIQFLDGSTVGY